MRNETFAKMDHLDNRLKAIEVIQDFFMNIIIAATLFLMKFSQWDQEFYEVALEIKNLRLWNETFAKMDHLDNRLKAI